MVQDRGMSVVEFSVRKWLGIGADSHAPFPDIEAKRMRIVVRHTGFTVGMAPLLQMVHDPFFSTKTVFVPASFLRLDHRIDCHVIVACFAVFPRDGRALEYVEPTGWIHVHQLLASRRRRIGGHTANSGQEMVTVPASALYPMSELPPILRLRVP